LNRGAGARQFCRIREIFYRLDAFIRSAAESKTPTITLVAAAPRILCQQAAKVYFSFPLTHFRSSFIKWYPISIQRQNREVFMEVDQKQITTIRLHDAKGGDVRLSREGNDYQLQLTSANTVVNITMGHADIRRLCQQIMQIDMEENWKFHYAHPEFKSFF